jgi:3-hydroxyacyl-[acyl-carrier-protein] dehydratase
MGRDFDRQAILERLPQQPPFCFVESASTTPEGARGGYTVRGDEAFLAGHFPGNPIFPASIVFEALGQVGCLWIIEEAAQSSGERVDRRQIFFTSIEAARFFRPVVPGDRLDMDLKLVRLRPPMAIFQGSAEVAGQPVAQIQRLVLAFTFAPVES